ncbi:unnamed protein product [Lactuca saligna]|uniref:Protein S-acyltransferase n=1 Tax=Lactuca saligna TaxID=75948 RepID=A0AA35ZD16_LACSI|nr:unnamed protein product [Lactuca saligna]
MKRRRSVSFPILAVLVLMEMVYYGMVFVFLDDWLGLQSPTGWINTVIFTSLASFTLFSFFVSVLIDPGGIPSGYFPDIVDNDDSDQESRDTVRFTFYSYPFEFFIHILIRPISVLSLEQLMLIEFGDYLCLN